MVFRALPFKLLALVLALATPALSAVGGGASGELSFQGPFPTEDFARVRYLVAYCHKGGDANELTFNVDPVNASVTSIKIDGTDLEALEPEYVNMELVGGDAVGEIILSITNPRSFPKNTTITLAELRNLEVGDIITTDKPATGAILVAAEGVPKYLADIGQYKGRRALKIRRAIEPSDRLA